MRKISKNIWRTYRGYPKLLIQKEMKKIKFTNIIRVKRQKETKGVTFVVTYHPLLKSLQNLNNSKHLSILYTDEETKKVITPTYDCIS